MVIELHPQRIARLTPLRSVLALVETRVGVVKPRDRVLTAALGRTLAEDVVASERPQRPIALRDGFAVEAAALADAGSYAPVPFASLPRRVDVGEPMPSGTDTVAPFDVVTLRGDRAEAVAPVLPGEGMLAAGADIAPQAPLRRRGERLRAIDLAIMATAGILHMMVREPRVRIVCGSATDTPLIDAAIAFLGHAVAEAGGAVFDARGEVKRLDDALTDDQADAVIAVGGTGSGRRDGSVQALARCGRVEVHGIAVSPGETAAFGFVGERPMLLVPGRLDAALSIWCLIARHLVARLAGGSIEDAPTILPLKRKATSTIGLTELIPVRRDAGMVEPLASGYLSLESMARSDGWIVIPADSEGYQAGTRVAVSSWP
jgi:molybdopterin biosynthesis enzyme